MSNAEFGKVKDFLSRSLDVFDISSNPGAVSTGDRVAVVSHAPPGFKPKNRKSPVKVEFSLITYNSKGIMRNHIEKSLQQLNGEGALGHAMEWTMKNIFSTAPKPRSHKVIIVISAGETSPWDREILKKASVRAKCQGYAVFVISLGQFHNAKEVEELTSIPLEQHLVQLGRTHKPELDYAEKFVKAFVRLLRGKLLFHSPVLGHPVSLPCSVSPRIWVLVSGRVAVYATDTATLPHYGGYGRELYYQAEMCTCNSYGQHEN